MVSHRKPAKPAFDPRTVKENIVETPLNEEMSKSFLEYAYSVIYARALPDARDGLKPVQRRIIYQMGQMSLNPDRPYMKSARVVGEVMGKLHPHGDSAIYEAMVRLAQPFAMRLPLVDGHGNFGSLDDGPAASRYTEARMAPAALGMNADIAENTVDFTPNYDNKLQEPTVLPAAIPNLLVNGTTGIAVGMATNIPPHNLREVINAVVKIIDNTIEEQRETTIEELLDVVKGPDFPTGATILGRRGIEEAYRTGRGKIRVRAVSNIETLPNGKSRIIVTELPYLVNKARLIEKIAELVRDKKVDGITDLSDQSSREGMRIVIELRKDVNANVLLNQLYKHTQLQDTFGVIMLALVGKQPKVMNILELLGYYLKHQEDVVTRRTKYELNKAKERAHILKGLLIALDNIDEVIRIIRGSSTVQAAKAELMEKFELDDVQAQAIVDMRLRALTGLEREKLEKEYAELTADENLYYKSVERIKFVDAERLSGEDTLVIADEKYTGKDIEDFKFKVTENEDGDYVLKANGNYVYVINGNLVYGTDAKEAEAFVIEVTSAPTANEGIATSEVKVIASEGNVTIAGAAGKKVVISNILGQVVANTVISSDNATIAAPAGVVVVAV